MVREYRSANLPDRGPGRRANLHLDAEKAADKVIGHSALHF
jgi:hypothetical protein